MTQEQPKRLKLGKLVATPNALRTLEAAGVTPARFLARHEAGDWGDLDAHDRKANDRALKNDDERILSAYHLPNGAKIWIITEWDRSVTTVLLPEDY